VREKEEEKVMKNKKSFLCDSNKRGSKIFWEEKNTSTSKIIFYVIPFSPSPSYDFENLF
jgi:hypothetical protein